MKALLATSYGYVVATKIYIDGIAIYHSSVVDIELSTAGTIKLSVKYEQCKDLGINVVDLDLFYKKLVNSNYYTPVFNNARLL